jgi:hypothetical protein
MSSPSLMPWPGPKSMIVFCNLQHRKLIVIAGPMSKSSIVNPSNSIQNAAVLSIAQAMFEEVRPSQATFQLPLQLPFRLPFCPPFRPSPHLSG